ncbi:MAG: glycine cleavage system protein H [Hyphomonas sp.]|jgi:glycine cleavage system H protein|uniref:glycine cleavage system protein GcvH n=1 Tax=Hyphomonas sp. TaxID=87 RepID=UPI0025C4E816|nr:glycine cleavage system protein GcvH [Hyphomonas sp.]MBA4338284.1 glycine cleavage system protein H [Hyphomonas sp.]
MTTYYTKDHEWIRVDGDTGTVGITNYAAGQLGDVVYVELPETGAKFARGDDFAVVESVKAASDVYAPVSGSVLEVNSALTEAPEKVNEAAQGDAWFVRVRLTDAGELSGLMDEAAYAAFCEGL